MKDQSLFTLSPAERTHDLGTEAGRLPDAFLVELILRHFSRLGELKLFEVAELMGMSASRIDTLLTHMRSLQLLEVPRRGAFEGDVSYDLTEAGQRQARLAFEKCQYVGPAPVTLDEYTAQVALQSETQTSVKAAHCSR